jgi:hypothetical protein
MRYCLLTVVVAAALLAACAWTAPAGPLTAGTAPGSGFGKLSPSAVQGVHYPFGTSAAKGYPSMPGSHPTNNTVAYDEMGDPARVAGHRAALSKDICIVTTHRRGTPYKAPI